jgi:hypothetical protein
MPRWEKKLNGDIIRGIKKTPAPKRSHTHDRVKIEFIAWAKETNHPEAWRGLMRSLSGLQQKVIFLIFQHGQNSVKAIARFGFETEQTTSSVLFKLSKLGVVVSVKRGRESLYSISESGLVDFLSSGSQKVK